MDLGYTESVAQTGAGWIGISEVPAGRFIQAGVQATRFLAENKWGFFGRNEVEGSLTTESANHINGLRLQRSLIIEQAKSIFTETGKLRSEIISKSDIIIPGEDLNNQKLIQELMLRGGDISDWGKYETRSILSPSGNFRVHFYRNSVTGEVYYGMDYKAVFDHQGAWDINLQPNFDYEPPKFNP